MTYRELLNLYKQGKLDDVRKKEVEASIEKQDAISEFLYEEGEIPEFSDLESENAENPENEEWLSGQKNNQKDEINRQFIKEIRWSIRKAFIKMGIIVGVAVLVIVLCAVFILPKAVSDFYYNPNEVVGKYEEMTTTRMDLDLSVYSELFLPGNHRSRSVRYREGMVNTILSFRRRLVGLENSLLSADVWCEETLLFMTITY